MPIAHYPLSPRLKDLPLLSLDADEQQIHLKLSALTIAHQLDEAISLSLSTSTHTLIKIALHDASLWQFFQRYELIGHWDTELCEIPSVPGHTYRAQVTIDSFNLLIGLYCYRSYLQCMRKNEKTHESPLAADGLLYLDLAAEYGCGHALTKLIALCTLRLDTKEPAIDDMLKLQVLGLRFAGLYFSTGFYSLALIYKTLAIAASKLPRLQALIDSERHHYYGLAVSALDSLQALIVFPESMAMLNNVYGMVPLPNFSGLEKECENQAAFNLHRRRVDAYSKGTSAANKLIQTYHLLKAPAPDKYLTDTDESPASLPLPAADSASEKSLTL